MTNIVEQEHKTLLEKSTNIFNILKTNECKNIKGIDPNIHYLIPFIPKEIWDDLGTSVSENEKTTNNLNVDGSKWFSFRLDGNCFSSTIKKLKRKGIFTTGFSEEFADIMKICTLKLMEKMNGSIGFTQSDEITIFVPPANITNGVQQQHIHNGRISKISTLASGLVSSIFMFSVTNLCIKKNISLDSIIDIFPCFDCRIGIYDSWNEAVGLLMWRAYDCSRNGVSDAVYQTGNCPKEIKNANQTIKLQWLFENNLLPLHTHQSCGTFFTKVKRLHFGVDPLTNNDTVSLRKKIEINEMNVIEIIRRDLVFPVNDEILSLEN
jgi:tRNA(His) 5'-end guanylyltransferase